MTGHYHNLCYIAPHFCLVWKTILLTLLIYTVNYMVQLSTKFTKTLVSSGVPRDISKITRGLFSNARVLQRTYKYLMHVSSARE